LGTNIAVGGKRRSSPLPPVVMDFSSSKKITQVTAWVASMEAMPVYVSSACETFSTNCKVNKGFNTVSNDAVEDFSHFYILCYMVETKILE
jgi:hypothetical protein